MGVTAKSLGIDKLDVENRLSLIGELWDSVSAETESLPMSVELKAELDQRIEDAESNPDIGDSWNEMKEATLARLRN